MLQKIFLIEVQLIPTTRMPGVLQSMGLQGVRHDLATEKQQMYMVRNENKLTTEIKYIF